MAQALDGIPASASFDLQLDAPPTTDLTVSGLRLVPDAALPDRYSVPFIVVNSGDPTEAPTSVKAYWADGPDLTNKLASEPVVFSTSLPAQFCGQQEIELSWDVIRLRPDAATHLVVVLDEENQVIEQEETNNVASVRVNTHLLADHGFHWVHPSATTAKASDDIDLPLVPTENVDVLSNQRPVLFGMVADGVTPLLGIARFSSLTFKPRYYQLSASVDGADVPIRFSTLDESGWKETDVLKEVPSATSKAFYYIMPVKSDDLFFASGRVAAEVSVIITPMDPAQGNPATNTFRIRKPPLVLVHGFNTAADTWKPLFTDVIQAQRGTFWKAVEYGASGGNLENTYGSFSDLAATLDGVLKRQIEGPGSPFRAEWAYTRYDVVGHSQGGVLARMLCTDTAHGTIPTFRSEANSYRGRFHRVVTIGSPHNGSTLVRYLLAHLFPADASVALGPNFLGDVAGEPPSVLAAARMLGSYLESIIPGIGVNLGLLQPKFDSFGPQIELINGSQWRPDPGARFHLVRTVVGGGQSPSIANPISWSPFWGAIKLMFFGRGEVVLPRGSDGIVDFDSQGAVAWGGTPAFNVSTMDPLEFPIAHSFPAEWLGAAPEYQTGSSDVARRAMAALNGDPLYRMGPFPPLPPVTNGVKVQLDKMGFGTVIVEQNIAALTGGGGRAAAGQEGVGFRSLSAGVETHIFQNTPLAGEPVGGHPVQWRVEGFGSNGPFTEGLTLEVEPQDTSKARLAIAPEVRGDVVLYSHYVTTSGRLVLSVPLLVTSRLDEGIFLQGIELRPLTARIESGSIIQPEIWGVYSNGSRRQMYASFRDVEFQSSNTNVLSAGSSRIWRALSPGQAVVRASFKGFSAQSVIAVDQPIQTKLIVAGASAANQIELRLSSDPGQSWRIESSLDFATWLPLLTLTNASGFDSFTAPRNEARRFFRAVGAP